MITHKPFGNYLRVCNALDTDIIIPRGKHVGLFHPDTREAYNVVDWDIKEDDPAYWNGLASLRTNKGDPEWRRWDDCREDEVDTKTTQAAVTSDGVDEGEEHPEAL
jgi:hypothetical protein